MMKRRYLSFLMFLFSLSSAYSFAMEQRPPKKRKNFATAPEERPGEVIREDAPNNNDEQEPHGPHLAMLLQGYFELGANGEWQVNDGQHTDIQGWPPNLKLCPDCFRFALCLMSAEHCAREIQRLETEPNRFGESALEEMKNFRRSDAIDRQQLFQEGWNFWRGWSLQNIINEKKNRKRSFHLTAPEIGFYRTLQPFYGVLDVDQHRNIIHLLVERKDDKGFNIFNYQGRKLLARHDGFTGGKVVLKSPNPAENVKRQQLLVQINDENKPAKNDLWRPICKSTHNKDINGHDSTKRIGNFSIDSAK